MSFPTRPLLVVLVAAASTALSATPATAPVERSSAPGPIDVGAMDRSVRPGNDFFAYANGTWAATATIPPDRATWGLTSELDERLRLQTREILEAAAKSDAPAGSLQRKVGDFYASAMDESAAESKGVTPIQPTLSRIAALKTKADLATYLGEELRADVDAMDCTTFHTSRLFGLWVAPDLGAPERSVPYLLQGGIGLPDREYYVSSDPKMVEAQEKYRAHVEALLGLAGVKDAKTRAARVLALENKMAKVHATRLES
ncbi:MAG TPA: M13 family metallopeptidase N-terminal domain-containing protein, partial [Myxococcaceae bacterium]